MASACASFRQTSLLVYLETQWLSRVWSLAQAFACPCIRTP